MKLDPLARVVLPHELGAGELDALAIAERRSSLPILAVAIERQEQDGKPRSGQCVVDRDRVQVLDDRLELVSASGGELLDLLQG